MISGVLSIFGHIGIIGASPSFTVRASMLTVTCTAVWGLRTSAIYDKQKLVSVFLGLLGTSVIVLLIVSVRHNRMINSFELPHRYAHRLTSAMGRSNFNGEWSKESSN